MSDATAPSDPGKAAGQAVGATLSWFLNWLNDKSALAVFAIAMLGFVLFAGYWTAAKIIPDHIDRINAGYAAQQVAYDKNLDKVQTENSKDLDKIIAAFKETVDRMEKHDKERWDIMREDRKPIAVLPNGVGS